MNHAGLDGRAAPDRLDRGQALQVVADEHEDVVHAAVLDFGEDAHPVLVALAGVAGPRPQDDPPALGSDDADRSVRDGAVADLHVDGVDEEHGMDESRGRLCHSAMPS